MVAHLKFNIGTSTNYLQFDGSNLQISGNISATTGTIGGFTVGDNYLRAGTGTTRISLSTVDGIHLGNNTFASAPFKVALNGDLTASSATIDGDITATTLTVEEANIQSLKLTLGGGILQDGSNNDLTVLNVINPDFPVDGLLHYFPLNGFSDPNDTTPADVIDVVSDVTGVITGSNGSFATDSPNGQSYVNGATTGITLLSDAQANTWQTTTGNYTVALWFKSTTESGLAAARIIGRDASDFWSLTLDQNDTGNQTVRLFTDGESVSWDGASVNEWHHIALVVNGTTSAKLYVDGVLRATDTNIAYTTQSRVVVLGCNAEATINPATNVFLGKFSDVRFYTKAITDKQVQSLYMNPAGGLPAKIEGDLFVTNTITADKLDVNTLDSISANLGSITAGDIDIGGGDFTVSATGVMTATGATISGNVTTTTLVVTEDADVIGNLKATSLASNIVKIGNLHQEVWNEIDARTATTQNGFYDEFTSAGGVGYIGVEKNFELLGSGSSGYLVNANNITLRGGSVSIIGSSTTQFTGTALQFTAQYQYKLTSGSTWTNAGSSYTATADVAESGGIYYYEVDADPDAEVTGLTADSYYQFRLKITPVVTNNVFRVSPTGAADSNGITIIFEAQQSSTSTGTGAGTVTSVTAGDGLSGGTITSSGTLAVDSTVVRTTGTQSIAGDKTFNNNIIIQGNLDVQGTTTTVNTDDLNVKDKNITLNYSTGDSSASANGAGITIQDAVSATQDATLTWNTSSDRFNFSHGLDFPASTLLVFGDNDDLRIQHNNANAVFSNFTGNIDFKNFADDSDIRFWSDDGAGGSAVYFKLNGSEGRSVASKDIRFEDAIKSTYGNSDDLQIYHDGSNSYISENGTGNLILKGGGQILLKSPADENMIMATGNGAVNLYYDNANKFQTTTTGINIVGTAVADNLHINSTSGQLKISRVGSSDNGIYWDRLGTQDAAIQVASNEQLNIDNNFGNPINLRIGADGSETTYLSVSTSGIDVTGTVTSDGLTVDGDASSIDFTGTSGSNFINAKQGLKVDIDSDNNQGAVDFTVTHDGGTKNLFNVDESGDISFYDDTGSTQGLFWDASAERLGIGDTTPDAKLTVQGDVLARDEFRGEVVDYAANQDAPYLIASTSGYTGATTNWNTYGFQHRIKSNSGGSPRITIDTAIGEAFTVTNNNRVGINTDSPSQALEVAGSIQIGGNATFTGTINSDAITSTGYITASSANGGVSLTHNDGYGNANVTFNHRSGVPEQNGQAARIAVNTDGTGTEGIIEFEVSASDVTSGTAVNLTTAMVLAHDFVEIPQYIYHYNDTDTYLRFSNDRVRLFAGGASVFDGSGQEIRLGNKVQIGDTTNQNQYGFLQVNQEANNDESGIGILDSTNARSMRLWADDTNSYISSGNTGTAPLILNEAITISSDGNLTGVGTISSGAITTSGNLLLDSASAEINLKSGIGTESGAVNWTFNTTGTNYASIKLPYDTRATTGFHVDSGYPITIDATTRINFAIGGNTRFRITNTDFEVGTTPIIDLNRNLTNIETIASGMQTITYTGSSTPSTGSTGLRVIDSRSAASNVGGSISLTGAYNGTTKLGQSPYIRAYKANASQGDYSFGLKFGIRKNGTGSAEQALQINEDKDATFAGSVTSSSGGFTATIGGIHVADGVTFGQGDHFLGDEGGQNDSETLLLRNGSSTSGNSGIKILAGYNDGGDTSGKIQLYTNGSTSSPKLEIDIDGNIKMGSTQIISSGRNLTNIESITAKDTTLTQTNDGATNLTLKRNSATGRSQFALANESGTQIWRVGMTGGGSENFVFYDGGANVLELNRSTNGASFAGTITSGAITSTGTSTFGVITSASYKVGATTVIDNSRNIINANSIALDDNKKLYLGTGDDVEFFFDGSQAILTSPDAHLCGSSGVRLATGFGVGQQTYLDADYSNGVRLYHEGSLKAQTQDDGFKVTGEIRGTQFAYSYYNSTSTTLTTSYAVVNLDTLQASTGISGIAVASNVVTISRSGTFMITLDIVTDCTGGSARSVSEAQLYKNGSAVTGTFVGMYNRLNGRGLSTGSATTMISVTSGDTFEIRAKKTGTDTVVTSVGGTRLTFLQVG